MQLPAALQPWSQELALLPLEIAEALGSLVRRLASAIGPLRAGLLASGDEVDGFRGLGRRGPLERLLIGEWLLAEESPDEFLRRAAEGELMFLELDRRQPCAGRRTAALLDCGPAQLGAPRIAHLALLVVLSRRARDAGAELRWGALQDPSCTLRALDSPDAVRDLLTARSATSVRADDLERWRTALGPQQPGDDLWLVGAAASWRETARESLVEIEDALDAELSSLEVRIRARQGRAPVLRLELPSPDVRARLLRDPYAQLRRGAELNAGGLDLSRGMHFSENGGFLMSAAHGGIAALAIPHSPRTGSTHVRPLRVLDEIPLAVHASRKRLVALTTDGAHLFWRGHWPFQHGGSLPLPAGLDVDPTAPLLPCFIGGTEVTFRDASGQVWVVDAARTSARRTLRAVVALARRNGRFHWLAREGGDLLWCQAAYTHATRAEVVHRFQDAEYGVLFGAGGSEPHAAALRSDGFWHLRTAKHSETLNLPAGMQLAGIVHHDGGGRLAAVAGREVVLVGGKRLVGLYRAATEILDFACSADGSRIALLTADGVSVLRASDAAELVHVRLEAEP